MTNILRSISVGEVVDKVSIRSVKTDGIERLKAKIEKLGFQSDKPLRVYEVAQGYRLIDGNHRLEAAIAMGLTEVPALIVPPPETELEAIKQARESNEASETVVPTTFVDDAELIWKLLKTQTQKEVGEALGWSRGKISQYANLSQVTKKAWKMVATTFSHLCSKEDDGAVAELATTVATPFTEGLLRNIVTLKPRQQLELVTDLAAEKINKARFKSTAEQYKANNEIFAHVLNSVGKIPLVHGKEKLRKPLMLEIYNEVYERNRYSKSWQKKGDATSTKDVDNLIQYVKDKINESHSITLIHGDFEKEVKNIADGFINLIVTDPPYNIASDRNMDYEGRKAVSYDFGEWDKVDKGVFLDQISLWAKEWYRIAAESASLYVFMSDKYFSHVRDALESAGWQIKNPLVWCKTNPGTTPVSSDRKSAWELILFAVKQSGKHTFHQIPNVGNQCLNYTTGPICQGNERIKLDKSGRSHPTQKPEWLLSELIEASSNKNEIVFDGFMGVGSVPAVAKKLGRKAIGIELSEDYYKAAEERLAND